ncbi:energy transducer TonB [Tenacibaculum agarivorans]|uniref:energy transducer TonB n=1 Tax=Tenacibaculum agarivorans TaxID=1908389 RepID=UPI00094B82D8|nr:energy transducer TonB [Tenacibaculum agarivorans]
MIHSFRSIFVVAILLSTNTIISQAKKHCDKPDVTNALDLNSISKCSIQKEDGNERKVVLNVASKNVRKRVVRKRETANSIASTDNLQKDISSSEKIEITNTIVTKNVVSEEILFSVVDQVPLFPECESTNSNSATCFNKEFSNHFAKNFDPERASEEGVSGRVFVQFTIGVKGNVNNLLIKSRNKNKQLEGEIKRVIEKLPHFSPGRHNGLPVNVKYSLPINFSD